MWDSSKSLISLGMKLADADTAYVIQKIAAN